MLSRSISICFMWVLIFKILTNVLLIVYYSVICKFQISIHFLLFPISKNVSRSSQFFGNRVNGSQRSRAKIVGSCRLRIYPPRKPKLKVVKILVSQSTPIIFSKCCAQLLSLSSDCVAEQVLHRTWRTLIIVRKMIERSEWQSKCDDLFY